MCTAAVVIIIDSNVYPCSDIVTSGAEVFKIYSDIVHQGTSPLLSSIQFYNFYLFLCLTEILLSVPCGTTLHPSPHTSKIFYEICHIDKSDDQSHRSGLRYIRTLYCILYTLIDDLYSVYYNKIFYALLHVIIATGHYCDIDGFGAKTEPESIRLGHFSVIVQTSKVARLWTYAVMVRTRNAILMDTLPLTCPATIKLL